MNDRTVIFEGYDGSGKSSLIQAIRDTYPEKKIRLVGRKTESELRLISNAIEDESGLLQPDTEMLLRFALETARQHLVGVALESNDLVVLDRGIISLLSWFDYLDVPRPVYDALTRAHLERCVNSLLVVCVADFETCWARIAAKSNHSKKERLGQEANARFYQQYLENVRRWAGAYGSVVYVDTTTQSLYESTSRVKEELATLGLP